ncbi:hypothetical protein EIB75_10785 [Epilithonimonas vandammei]|uniref:Uncharacterized protein n=1 Tax=Epilithonimonas vandammei TaxID=2487072 RepID=A0A3G8ZEV5_9FLAO|nr:hypothetical protein [Epilithonimonas vandammei]AZI53874.1 hypothetical protein EIB75_00770 [Epilithonimonas vandammei]AZI55708.1 hypothetical protein EIB75_10785 [Epilithonimonas vandammei]
MNRETHNKELQELFKGEKLNFSYSKGIPSETLINVKRELSRLELGHCFSLGLTKIKKSGEGLSLTFIPSKVSINSIYQNLENN